MAYDIDDNYEDDLHLCRVLSSSHDALWDIFDKKAVQQVKLEEEI